MALMAHMSNKQRPIKKPEAVLARNVSWYIKIYLDEYLHTTSAKLSDIHNTHNAIQFVFDIAKQNVEWEILDGKIYIIW